MKTYELSYIISPEITSEDSLAKAKEIESAIQSREGTVLKQLAPIAKTLSYPIAKRASGFFGVLEFNLEPEKLLELKEIFEKDTKIVRHMLTIKQPAEMKKERRTREVPRTKIDSTTTPTFEIEHKKYVAETEKNPEEKLENEKPFGAAQGKEKVELKDIEQKLEEILGE